MSVKSWGVMEWYDQSLACLVDPTTVSLLLKPQLGLKECALSGGSTSSPSSTTGTWGLRKVGPSGLLLGSLFNLALFWRPDSPSLGLLTLLIASQAERKSRRNIKIQKKEKVRLKRRKNNYAGINLPLSLAWERPTFFKENSSKRVQVSVFPSSEIKAW